VNQTENPTRNIPAPPPIRPRKTKTRVNKHVPKQRSPRKPIQNTHRKTRKELSAGGVVVRQERGQWLVALLKTEHKRGMVWVLPKGHVEIDAKERVSNAARREVEEESGISDLAVKDQLGTTRFTFQAENAIIRKTVHYFLMTTNQKTLVPQEEEYFYDAAWFPIDIAIQTLEYDTDQDIVAKARQKLTGQPANAKKIAPQRATNRAPRIVV